MRKTLMTLGLALLLTTSIYGKNIVLNINDAIVWTPVAPIQEAGTTLVPLRIIGEFKEMLFHGQGKMIYANGNIYEGEYREDLFHGQGKFIYANGDIQEGRFEYGEFKGAVKHI